MKRVFRTVQAFVLLTALLCLAFPSNAAQNSQDSVIVFNDAVLEAVIRRHLNKPEGPVTIKEAASLGDWLDANGSPEATDAEKIRDVSVLRYFTNLYGIRMDNNLIEDISPLAELTQLKELWVLDNPIKDVQPLASLKELRKLGFKSNFQNFDFVGDMLNLEELRVDACRELPGTLTKLKNLKVFCTLGGELADLSLLAQIPTLEIVDVSWNLVKDLTPLSGLPLKELYLQGNPIEDFSPIKDIYPKLAGRNFEYIETKNPENPSLVITFPDPVMEKKVREAIDKPQGDITAGDAAKVIRLSLANEWSPHIPDEIQIRDLTGIEHFISLRELDASFNAIEDIMPLAGLTELTKVELGGNSIRDISVLSGLTNIEQLEIFNARISDLSPLTGLTKLHSLHIGGIQISDLSPLSGLTNIDHLYAGGCGIEDISPLAGMTNMYWIELSNNYITDLTPLQGMHNLVMLMLANNPIQDYSPIKDIYPRLEEKDFEYGQVFEVEIPLKPEKPDEPVKIGDAALEAILRETTNIFDKPLTQRNLSSIWKIVGNTDGMWQNVSDLSALKYCLNIDGLFIFNSKVSDLTPLGGLTKLHFLCVCDSAVEDISPLAGVKQLTALEVRGNRIADVSALSELTELRQLDLRHNQIADFSPLFGLEKLEVLFISDNPGKDTSGFKKILSQLNEKDFEPGQPMQPTSQLEMPKNPDKVVKFTDKVLEKRIREAMGKPEGKITAGDAALVEELYLGNEYQEKFPKGTQISDLSGIEYFINLKQLDISWNRIKDIKKLERLTRLECLQAFGNQITSIASLKNLINLTDLNVGGNKLTKIDPLSGLVNLKALYLENNNLTKIDPLSNLTNLTRLNLKGNKIKDYSPVKAIYPQLTEKDFTIEE